MRQEQQIAIDNYFSSADEPMICLSSLSYLKYKYWRESKTFYLNNKDILSDLSKNIANKIPYEDLINANHYDYCQTSNMDNTIAENFKMIHKQSFLFKKSFRDFVSANK